MSAATPARSSWLDDDANTPLIAQQAQRLDTFIAAMADGRIDDGELAAQESRVVALMREVEPQLSDAQHQKVTQLLCELTAYDVMQMVHSIGAARAETTFRG
jgi:hypothetical protein